jgi:YidC/Oxa1 family membrane protein insertase
MNSETRFILAVVLMLAVLVGGNLLFPPPPPEELAEGTPEAGEVTPVTPDSPTPGQPEGGAPGLPPGLATEPDPGRTIPGLSEPVDPGVAGGAEPAPTDPATPLPAELPAQPAAPIPERLVVVESPLYRFALSNVGARLESAEILGFRSFTREGPVQLVEDGMRGLLGVRVVVEGDTIDLRTASFRVLPEEGLRLEEGAGPQTLTFEYQHSSGQFGVELAYTFDPGSYLVGVRGNVRGIPRGLILTDLGGGLAFNEVDEGAEARGMAYVVNHLQDGIRATELSSVSDGGLQDGPFLWTAMKSQYFVVGILPAAGTGGNEYLGGVLVNPVMGEDARVDVSVSQSLGGAGVSSTTSMPGRRTTRS